MTAAVSMPWPIAGHAATARLARSAVAERVRWRHVLVLCLAVPLFGQSFYYFKDLPPLWALSKIFPILSLPLVAAVFGRRVPPGARQVLVSFVWLVLVPTFVAIGTFQQTFFVGLVAQLKLLPLLHFFSFLGLLYLLRPTLREIALGFLIWAAITFVALLLIGALVPQSWYATQYVVDQAPLLSNDGRGNRIRMPMFLALLGLFYYYRRFLATRRFGWLLLTTISFGLVVGLVRTRSMVLGIAAIFAINAFIAASPRVRWILVLCIPLALAGLFTVPYVASVFRTDTGSGFDVRWISTIKAIDFLGGDPLRWLFGVGTISPLDAEGLMTYFNHFFFLADITWVGVVFEFGLIGAGLILALAGRALLLVRRARTLADSPFLQALQDYIVYVVLISELYPMTLAPGELAVVMAVAVYAMERMTTRQFPVSR